MNVVNQPVLCLNGLWQALNTKTVKEALIAMLGNVDWDSPEYVQPVDWETWKNLPVRDYDLAIHTSNMTIRAPRVIIQPNYSKMPLITPRPTKESIRKRDGGVCQYTGKAISWKEGNIDHVIPRTKGGRNTFENMVWCHKDINSKKADKTPDQAGLKLIRKPKAPPPVPVSSTIQIAHHPSWIHFLDNVTEVRGMLAS
jgi:5-methylcytosine-specific restriction endonuclease McrA